MTGILENVGELFNNGLNFASKNLIRYSFTYAD